MKLTWTFYPKGQPSVTLTVVYRPELDHTSQAGYLETETNTAFVSWDCFRIFDRGSQVDKKALFESLSRFSRDDLKSKRYVLPETPNRSEFG